MVTIIKTRLIVTLKSLPVAGSSLFSPWIRSQTSNDHQSVQLSRCLSLPQVIYAPTGKSITGLPSDLVTWVMGNQPANYTGQKGMDHPMSKCNSTEFIPKPPMSPTLAGPMPCQEVAQITNWESVLAEYVVTPNLYFTGIVLSMQEVVYSHSKRNYSRPWKKHMCTEIDTEEDCSDQMPSKPERAKFPSF